MPQLFDKQKLIVLAGPTGVGKTELSLGLAERFGAEVVSMDSMQVYKYMDIGTAKPSPSERARVPHHLIDYVEPDEVYHAGRFVRDARRAIADIAARKRLPMLVGGTGLYMKSLLQGVVDLPEIPQQIRNGVASDLSRLGNAALHAELAACDAASAARIHSNDSQRLVRGLEIFRATGIPWSRYLAEQEARQPEFSVLKIGMRRPRSELYARINARVDIMVAQGLVEEVQGLLEMGFGPELGPMQSIGYRHMVNYIEGHWSWEEALRLLARDTRRYAKRQFTWFGRDSHINWFHPYEVEAVYHLLERNGF